jgi:hypothetical protein
MIGSNTSIHQKPLCSLVLVIFIKEIIVRILWYFASIFLGCEMNLKQ